MKKPSNEQNPRPRSAFRAIRAIDYTVIVVRDMTAMRRFYEDILGFALLRELSPRGLGQARPDCSGCSNASRQCLAATRIQGFRSRG